MTGRQPHDLVFGPYDDEQIRALRRARGLSRAQLATLVGAARKGRRLSMGGAETHAIARVLATNHRAPPVSVAQAGGRRNNAGGTDRDGFLYSLSVMRVRIDGGTRHVIRPSFS